MKKISLVIAFLLGLGLQSLTANSNATSVSSDEKTAFGPLEENPNDDELKKLLKRRYNLALDCHEAFLVREQSNETRDLMSMSRVVDVSEVLLEAGLEVFDDPKVQERLLVEHIDRLKAFGDLVAITENEGAQCNAAIRKLTAEIRLLKFRRQMQAAPGK
jgi:hypothetical protein